MTIYFYVDGKGRSAFVDASVPEAAAYKFRNDFKLLGARVNNIIDVTESLDAYGKIKMAEINAKIHDGLAVPTWPPAAHKGWRSSLDASPLRKCLVSLGATGLLITVAAVILFTMHNVMKGH